MEVFKILTELSPNETREVVIDKKKAILKRQENRYKALIYDLDFPHHLPTVVFEINEDYSRKIYLRFSDVRNVPVPHKGFLRYIFRNERYRFLRILENLMNDVRIYYMGGDEFQGGNLEQFLNETLFPDDYFKNRILIIESQDEQIYEYFQRKLLKFLKAIAHELKTQSLRLLNELPYTFREVLGFDRYEFPLKNGLLILSRRFDSMDYMVHFSPNVETRENFRGRESYMWNIQAASSEYSDGTIPTFEDDIYIPSWSFRVMKLNKHTVKDFEDAVERSLKSRRVIIRKKTESTLSRLLQKYKQLILYGPPGTGKTHKAIEIANEFADEYTIIQMHPSYSYEEFVEGIRPTSDGKFTVKNGIFKEFALKALNDAGKNYVIILDEVSRCDLVRVFGELLFLLEYRGKPIILPYSREKFIIPQNLFIIGTMNTADRSVSTLDIALRRRFAFYKMLPDENVIREYYMKNDYNKHFLDKLLKVFNYMNELIMKQLGEDFLIGHTYFMVPPEDFEEVFELKILPVLKDVLSKNDLKKVISFKESVMKGS